MTRTHTVCPCVMTVLENYCGSDPVYHYATQSDFVGKKPFLDFVIVTLMFSDIYFQKSKMISM